MIQTNIPTTEKETKMTTSPKRIARIADVLYLLVIGVKTVKPGERILAVG